MLRSLANFIQLLGLLMVASNLIATKLQASAKVSDRPNIIFVFADDVSRDTWGAYGSVDCKTPHIDRLAREGVRFDRAYCAVAMCAPFRQELFSGRSPWRTKAMPNHSTSSKDTRSIPHYLKPLGYDVHLIGKTHIGPKACYPFTYHEHGRGSRTANNNPDYLRTAGEIMDRHLKDNQPFCIFIASNDGHAPFTTGDPSAYQANKLTIPPYWIDVPELRQTLVDYYAEITNFDSLVGDLRAALEKRKLWDNTIFMVCSEQGSQLPFAKWTCYDNGLRTGLIAHWTAITKAGHVAEDLVSISDLAPTLVEAAGGRFKAEDFDGKSFLRMLKGESQTNHEFIMGAFINRHITDNKERVYPIRSLRTKRHALIFNPNFKQQTSNLTLSSALAMLNEGAGSDGEIAAEWVVKSMSDASLKPIVHKLHHRPEYEFYDLQEDPHELNNLIDDPAHQQSARALKAKLRQRLVELGDADPLTSRFGR